MGGRGGDLRMARKLGAKELQLLILSLLGERPAHGYELIKTIEERSGGFYSPSPGMIYPALTYLDEIGYASIEQEGTRKLYRITPEGQAHLDDNRAAPDGFWRPWRGWKSDGRRARSIRGRRRFRCFRRIHRGRRALKDALRRKRSCDAKEATRIAQILHRAATEISAASPVSVSWWRRARHAKIQSYNPAAPS